MKSFRTNTFRVLIGTCLIFGATLSAQAAEYSGSFTAKITKQEALSIMDSGQHVLVLQTSTGPHKSTGKNGYFDGGTVIVNDTVDLVNGSGTHHGYWTVTKDGETVTNSLTGKVKTVMAADGKTPITTIDGTFDGLYGTNLYGTLHPVGTYTVKFTSPTEYMSTWEVTGFK